MGAYGNWLKNTVGDHWLRGQTPTVQANAYIALFSTDPTALGTGTELSGNGYARVAVERSLDNWSGTQGAGTVIKSNGTSGQFSNNLPIVFPPATAAWPAATHWAMFDAVTGGNLMFHGALQSPITGAVSDAIEFPAGYLEITLD